MTGTVGSGALREMRLRVERQSQKQLRWGVLWAVGGRGLRRVGDWTKSWRKEPRIRRWMFGGMVVSRRKLSLKDEGR